MAHDFLPLSSLDFEELCRDLLQKESGVRYELFKPGRDGGVDARHLNGKHKTVVQCKHYVRSGITKLLSVLEKEELPKVKKLAPDRYIVMTSVPLSKDNKQKIAGLFKPFITSENDIYGQEDLNNLLRLHPDVEQNNFKLWLTSKAVLDRVIHNAVITQSEQLVAKVQAKIPIFVQNKSYPEAFSALNEHRFVIIAGEPGVGKTTLADMLLFSYMEDEYYPVAVKSPKDAYDIYSPEKKIVYYFDDFLGLSRFGDNFGHDTINQIVQLIDLVRKSNNSRMILTSREYIIMRAVQQSERFSQAEFLHAKYQLKLSNYTRVIKAKILYNHLYFSALSDEYIDELISTKTYLKIVEHPHYTPRLIQWLTDPNLLKGISKADYPAHFLATLQNPKILWEHPFRQISNAAQNLLLVLLSLGSAAQASRLDKAFGEFHSFVSKKYGQTQTYDDFNNALKELLGSFLKIEQDEISFHNPSIKDFLEDFMINSHQAAGDIFDAALFLAQIKNLWLLLKSPESEIDKKFIAKIIKNFVRLKENAVHVVTHSKASTSWRTIDLIYAVRLSFFIEIYSYQTEQTLEATIYETFETALKTPGIGLGDITDWISLAEAIDQHADNLPDQLKKAWLFQCNQIVEVHFNGVYNLTEIEAMLSIADMNLLPFVTREKCHSGFLASEDIFKQEYTEERSSSGVKGYLDSLKDVAEALHIDITSLESEIESRVEEMAEHESDMADHEFDNYRESRAEGRSESREIDGIFDNLNDR